MAKKSNPKLMFEGEKQKHYEALLHARELVTGQMKYHVEDTLDCSNADHRGSTTHMADVSTDNSRHEMELKMLTEESSVLQLIEDAIKRLVDGGYGICQECGQPISEKRLEIRPYAIYCVSCKSKLEKQGFNVSEY